MTVLGAVAVAAALAGEPAIRPLDHQARGLALGFERLDYHGVVYLNADGSYLIVQTGPDGRTEPFSGRWSGQGASGVCIAPASGEPGKCLPRLPQTLGAAETITSDLGEDYRLTLQRRR